MADPVLILETGSGLPNSNSYVSLAEAEIFASVKLEAYKSAWTAADSYQKEQVLIGATLLLDDWILWPGIATTSLQALRFPRSGVLNPDGFLLPSFSVYPFVKRATVELAMQLLSGDVTEEPPRGLSSLRVGPIALAFAQGESKQKRVIPRSVMSILTPYGCRLRTIGSDSVGSLPLARA